MRKLFLKSPFAEAWKDRDAFEEVEKLEGELFRSVKTRRTLRFEFAGSGYFIKIHHGTGWREIFKNLFQFKLPVLGAANEFHALELLHSKGVETMECRAFGERNANPARRDSFLITSELQNMASLEDYCRDWSVQRPAPDWKHALIRKLAHNVRTMHEAGMNHRDCYLCHFLLDLASANTRDPHLHVIDLHRAEIRKFVPLRYLLKDVGGLWFSAMDAGLTRRDLLRFIAVYGRKTPQFWAAVDRTARKLYRKVHRREAPNA